MSADATNTVRLLINGQTYAGWISVRVSAGIERQARDFALEATDRWPGQTDIPRRIQPGDACQLYLGADLVLTGYVDATPIRYDGTSVSVAVRGRSKTADLVDCCPLPSSPVNNAGKLWGDVVIKSTTVAKPVAGAGRGMQGIAQPAGSQGAGAGRGSQGVPLAKLVSAPAIAGAQWRNQKLEKIAAALAAPYGVRVLTEIDTGRVITDHTVQVGETVFESIDRMMRLRHVLSTDNVTGDLVFIDAGSAGRAGTAIELGVNVLAASTDLDYSGVFSRYIVRGQRSGSPDAYGSAVSEEEGESLDDSSTNMLGETATAIDARAKRTRVLVLKQSGQADAGTCQDRANYERAHRSALALQTTYTVSGWRQADGTLWSPNTLVRVRDGVIGFDTEMLSAEVTYLLDAQGMRTELRMGPVDGYVSQALKRKKTAPVANWSDVK